MTRAALADWRSAPLPDSLRQTLGFLELMTRSPADVDRAAAAAVRCAGVSEAALVDAVYVCALFNLIDRVADAFGFELRDGDGGVAGL